MTTKLKQRIAKLEESQPSDMAGNFYVYEAVDEKGQFIELRGADPATGEIRALSPSEIEATRHLTRIKCWPDDWDL